MGSERPTESAQGAGAHKPGSHDVCRHSWFTFFVASFDSFAKAMKEGGNSEQIVKVHYESPAKKRGEQAKKFWTMNPPTVENANIIPFKKSACARTIQSN